MSHRNIWVQINETASRNATYFSF